MGRRQTGSSRPISAIAAFTGIGLDSTKLMFMSGRNFAWISRAAAKSLRRQACAMAVISAGISLEATEITPRPPSAVSGIVMASSPESTMKSAGTSLSTVAIWPMLPLASFTPTMLSILARRASVAGSTLTPVRPCTLYTTMGRRVDAAIAR